MDGDDDEVGGNQEMALQSAAEVDAAEVSQEEGEIASTGSDGEFAEFIVRSAWFIV